MKVLHVIESLEFGGAEKVVVDLANTILERMPVGICCVKRLGQLRDTLDPRITVHCLGKDEGNDYRLPAKLIRLVEEHGYDIVHSHNWGIFLEPALARSRMPLRRLIHTVHGRYLPYPPKLVSSIKRRIRRVLERRLAHRYDAIVAVSDTIREYVKRDLRVSDGRVLTIHNGIHSEPSAPVSRCLDAITFVTVGRLAEVKNQPLMLRAFARVAPTLRGARLRIIGDGPERSRLEALAHDLGLDERVEFLGFRDDVKALLAEADVFLISSHYEGISIALLEAMRAGLPVVASCVGGVPETVIDGHNGILFPDGDEHSMSAAMGRLGSLPYERKAMGERSLARLRKEFSIEVAVERYWTLYGAENAN